VRGSVKFDDKKKTFIVEPIDMIKSWWCGDPRVEPYMHKVKERIDKHVLDKDARTDIYNRAYEAVYAAIQDYDKKKIIGEL
jgi:hypothetical protein